MNLKELLAKRTHLLFACGCVIALALSISIKFMSGQTLRIAAWKAISEIKPMDYLMLALFWYSCTVRPKDDWDSSLISLNLGRSPDEK